MAEYPIKRRAQVNSALLNHGKTHFKALQKNMWVNLAWIYARGHVGASLLANTVFQDTGFASKLAPTASHMAA
jgi:hypothetical protein